MFKEIPEWAALLIGGGVGLLLAGLLLTSIKWSDNAKRAKETKRKTNDEDHVSFELPSVGYDSSGYHLPTELEAQVEVDPVEIEKIQKAAEQQKEMDLRRKRIGKKARRRVYH